MVLKYFNTMFFDVSVTRVASVSEKKFLHTLSQKITIFLIIRKRGNDENLSIVVIFDINMCNISIFKLPVSFVS